MPNNLPSHEDTRNQYWTGPLFPTSIVVLCILLWYHFGPIDSIGIVVPIVTAICILTGSAMQARATAESAARAAETVLEGARYTADKEFDNKYRMHQIERRLRYLERAWDNHKASLLDRLGESIMIEQASRTLLNPGSSQAEIQVANNNIVKYITNKDHVGAANRLIDTNTWIYIYGNRYLIYAFEELSRVSQGLDGRVQKLSRQYAVQGQQPQGQSFSPASLQTVNEVSQAIDAYKKAMDEYTNAFVALNQALLVDGAIGGSPVS